MLHIKKQKKNIGIEVLWMTILSVVVFCSIFLVFHLYEIDLRTMIYVQEDACGAAMTMHTYIMNINMGNGIQTLFQSIFSSNLEGAMLHKVGMFLCCLFVDEFGIAVNIYYFAGYFLTAWGMYIAMRVLKKEPWIAACCGILYTFLPYHYLRGESHIFLACYYMVPIGCAVIVRLLDLDEAKDRLFYIGCMIVAILMGITDIYYSVFWVILLLFVVVFIFINTTNIKQTLVTLSIGFIPFLSLGVVNIPYLYNSFTKHSVSNNSFILSSESERTLSDLLFYGLRISQLLYPIQNHRLTTLAKFRDNLDQYLGNDETRMVSLGLVMAIGFIISLAVLLINKNNKLVSKIKKYGLLNVFIIFVASIGGLNIYVGLISANIRCYNRMSIFIAAFSLMTLAEIIQSVWEKQDKKRILVLVVFSITLFGVWDQTAPFSQEEYAENWNIDHNTKTMVQEIDSLTREDAQIIMFPIILKGNGALIHDMRNYEQSWNAAYSDNLKWITGRTAGYRQWLSALSVLSTKEALDYILLEDIDGIWLDENGYSMDEFSEVKCALDNRIGNPIVISETGKQYYYSLEECRNNFRGDLSNEELASLMNSNQQLKSGSGYYIGVKDLSTLDNEEECIDNSFVLQKDDLQYGPYLSVREGSYQLIIVGDNLQNANLRIHYDYGAKSVNYDTLKISDQKWIISFDLNENVNNLEFLLSNPNEQSITLQYYLLNAI